MAFTVRSLVLGGLFVAARCSDDQMLLQAAVNEPEISAADTKEETGDLSALLAQPDGVIEDMTSKVGALTAKMMEMKKTNEVKMSSQAEMFKKRLADMAANSTSIANRNGELKAEIDALVTSNADKRAHAKELSKSNTDFLTQLRSARVMIDTAAEFVDRSIQENSDVDVADLQVLSELDEKDTIAAVESNHQGRLDDIANARKPNLGMLDVSPSKTAPAANDLVSSLEAGLDLFAQEAKKSEEALKARFLENYKQASLHQAELLKEQGELTHKRKMLKTLEARLATAVEHLAKTHAVLQERVQAVQGFAQGKLGDLKKAVKPEGEQSAPQGNGALSLSQMGVSTHRRLARMVASATPLSSFGADAL